LGIGIYGYFYSSNLILCEDGLAAIERLTERRPTAPDDLERRTFLRAVEIADRKITVFCPKPKDDRRKSIIAAVVGIVLIIICAGLLRSLLRSRKWRSDRAVA
jgi:hypothetical protein